MPSNAPRDLGQGENHTYEVPCRLAPVAELEQAEGLEDIPPIRAQYFYSSPITIDDPLSAPAASGAFASGAKGPLRPFSAGDNNALERAWLSLASEEYRESHGRLLGQDHPNPTPTGFVGTIDPPGSPGTPQGAVVNDAASSGGGRHANAQKPGDAISPIHIRPPIVDDGILGKPFVRSETEVLPRVAEQGVARTPRRVLSAAEEGKGKAKISPDAAEVTVGVSRLHMVSLPMLQMRPIYWSPVNDVSVVLRATWFYSTTMMPVEPAVANQLEVGYRELKPWTETWSDELRSALEVGALGEEKVTFRLWPESQSAKKPHGANNKHVLDPRISSDAVCAARCFRGEAAAEGNLEFVHPGMTHDTAVPHNKGFPNHWVVYKDECSAFLLKPSLQPSAYYGRRPVLKIMKGLTVGIPVVRAFDRKVWERLNNQKPSPAVVENLRCDESEDRDRRAMPRSTCSGCQQDKARNQVTDLCFVIHGIGQKLAERVESFHFTHAINTFRRAIAIELARPATKAVLRDGHKGIVSRTREARGRDGGSKNDADFEAGQMVLPINWRHALRMEDGGPRGDDDQPSSAHGETFGLRDIEPNTIKVIRSLISDMMFDVPLYMSNHKPKMIAALIGEANRVYRLWLRNNKDFSGGGRGRVHLIGHSLGSAMALDVLSRQPSVPPVLDLSAEVPNLEHFEFDTTNLFLLGSPAAFFLLLERCSLVPRRGRYKPGADVEDIVNSNVVGDTGAFGCLAVDNVYNILAKEDPIAYLLNAAIDPVYAASLDKAFVPSTATSLFQSVNNTMKSLLGFKHHGDTTTAAMKRPSTLRLPSQLELEVHDFSREEVAEKKAFLLNDNGQIDYYLHSGGGPLEMQYLNMLTAHTSYWSNEDLIRFVCVEVGREPGKENTLLNMRAVKALRRKPGTAQLPGS